MLVLISCPLFACDVYFIPPLRSHRPFGIYTSFFHMLLLCLSYPKKDEQIFLNIEQLSLTLDLQSQTLKKNLTLKWQLHILLQ